MIDLFGFGYLQKKKALLKAFELNGIDRHNGRVKTSAEIQLSLAYHSDSLGLTNADIGNLSTDKKVIEILGNAGFKAHLKIDAPAPSVEGIIEGLKKLETDLTNPMKPWINLYSEIVQKHTREINGPNPERR